MAAPDTTRLAAPPPAAPGPAPEVDLDPVVAHFRDPERYLRRRERGFARLGKHVGERRALRKLLAGCGPIESVLDCPCGPGRLFDLWVALGMTVIALDRSPAMVEAARHELCRLAGRGRVSRGEVKDLDRVVGPPIDLVTSIRFAYYFDDRARPELLRLLARRSRRWVLVQYKTTETWKGRRNQRRGRNQGKHFLSLPEIRSEFAAAGLELAAFAPHGPLSDRALALGEVRRPR